LKKYALDCIERIKTSFSSATGGIGIDFAKVGETIKSVLGAVMGILEGGVLFAIKTVMNTITSGIQVAIGAFKVLWNVARLILWPIETVIKVIISLFNNGWSGAIETIKSQFSEFGNIFNGIFAGIRTIIGGFADFYKGQFINAVEFVNKIFGNFGISIDGIFADIKSVVSTVGEFFKSAWSGAVNFTTGIFEGLGNFFKFIFSGIKSVIETTGAFFKNVWDNAFNFGKSILEGYGNAFKFIFDTIRAVVGAFTTFFKEVFNDPVGAVKNLFNSLGDIFSGVLNAMKEKISSFVDFFTDKFTAVKDFFGGIGSAIGGFFSGGQNKNVGMAAHAVGGIFKDRHIAEIAERGAEAVVPLNNSKNGLDIWRQAGAMGGYLQKEKPETGTQSGTSPIINAAAGRMSGGENIINMTCNFNIEIKGTPDSSTASQITEAGQKIAGDFEARVKEVMENIMRDKRRVSYA
jgi:phage-related protein